MTVPTSRRLLALVAALAASTLMAGTALGHAALVASSPAEGARVPAGQVRAVTLTFDDDLDATRSQFALVDEGGTTVATGRVAADPRMMTAGGLSLAPGAYQARWTAATADGGITRGIVSFLAEADTSASAQVGATEPSGVAAIAPSAAAAAAATAPGDSTPTDPGNVMAPITVAAAFVVLVAVLLARRSRAA